MSFLPLCFSHLASFFVFKKYSCLKNQKHRYPELQRMKKYGIKVTGRKKNHATIICREFEMAFFKSIDYKVKPKKGDLQKHKNVFNQKILNVAIKETVTLKVDFFKSIKWWRGTTITTVTKVK